MTDKNAVVGLLHKNIYREMKRNYSLFFFFCGVDDREAEQSVIRLTGVQADLCNCTQQCTHTAAKQRGYTSTHVSTKNSSA